MRLYLHILISVVTIMVSQISQGQALSATRLLSGSIQDSTDAVVPGAQVVLERDGYRCRVCDASGRDKRSIIVHHRVPGKSVLRLMISLCPSCHAKVHRTIAVLSKMPPVLLDLWREQHPTGHEQKMLNFSLLASVAQKVPLFVDDCEEGRPDEPYQDEGHPDKLINGYTDRLMREAVKRTQMRADPRVCDPA